MNEQVRSIEEAAVAALAADLRANVDEMERRMAAKDAGKGEFDITTVEDLGLELIEKTKQTYAEMYSRLLSAKDREAVKKKTGIEWRSGDQKGGKERREAGEDADHPDRAHNDEADGVEKDGGTGN